MNRSKLELAVHWAVAVSATIGGVVLALTSPSTTISRAEFILFVPLSVLYVMLGLLIAIKRPGNRISVLLVIIGASTVINGFVEVRIDGKPDPVSPLDVFAVVWSNVGYFIGLLIPLLLLLYLFPTGRLLTRRWRWVAWAAGISVTLLVAVGGFANEVAYHPGGWTIPNPVGFHDIPDVTSEGLSGAAFGILVIVLVVVAPIALVLRYRRSSDVVRAQVKIAVWAMALVPLIFLSGVLASEDSFIKTVVFVGALAAVPIAITVAIVRHNLFDIDVVISRSLSFGVLLVFIGGVYVGIVVGLGELLGGGDGAGFGLSVAATAVVAIGFQPVRVRVEGWANRLVYGKRVSPYEVLASFSHRAVDESDEDVLARIPRLMVDGSGASGAVVWVRSKDGFRVGAAWPEEGLDRHISGFEVFVDPDGDVSFPVFHDGELLGGVSVVAERGSSITPPERELISNLADGLGLTLRNAQLTAALRQQVKDLQRSRDRIVSAADAARRSLEHDLDSGPQQLLVAAKVKLGPIRKLAEQAGATKTAGLLADIESQTGDAIQAVRDFAAGVYPPLLGADGLVVALTQETRKAAVPVVVEADGVGRYPRDIEAAVYFSVLEALQNTAKYAEASQATVKLTATNGDLVVEVSDNGKGFDPATVTRGAGLSSITDRIDTIGGTTTITSTPNHGTTITATIPTTDHPTV